MGMTHEEAINRLEDTFEAWERWNPHNDSPSSKLSEALGMAIAALREQPRWISVEERLPTPYQNVIVWRNNYLDNSGCVDIDFTFVFNDGEVEWADHMRTWKSVVTHWMPMPEAPEVEV